MKGRLTLFIVIAFVIAAAWGVMQKVRGPLLPGYEIIAQPLVQTVVATGRVAAVSRAQIGSPVTGVLVERRVQEGDTVQPGDILAIVRADDLEAAVREAEANLAQLQESTRPQAQAALREAEIALKQASREAQRRRTLFQQGAIAREEMERALQAETAALASLEQAQLVARALISGNPTEVLARARLANAEAQLAKTTIRSEVSGTVLTRNAEPGDLVQPSRILFEIARNDDTEVLVPLDEKNLEVLEIGQSAVCIADAFPTRPFPAHVSFIAPSVDPQRGTVDVRLTVAPGQTFLRQDMTVSVNVETGRKERALVVPNDALIDANGNAATVWLVSGGRAMHRPVTLGLRGLTHTEIIEGLGAGDWVLANDPADVVEGTRIRVRAESIAPATRGSNSATRAELPIRMD